MKFGFQDTGFAQNVLLLEARGYSHVNCSVMF